MVFFYISASATDQMTDTEMPSLNSHTGYQTSAAQVHMEAASS